MRDTLVQMRLDPLSIDEVVAATSGQLVAGRDVPIRGVSIDSRALVPGELFVAILGPHFDGHEFIASAVAAGASAIVVAREAPTPPGITVIRVTDTTRALADMARERRRRAGIPVVAITGSTGKTTTKEMTAALLGAPESVLRNRGNLNNRYGLPLTLLALASQHTSAALELGMSHAGELRELTLIARPDVAVITNVSAAHLENFDTIADIASAKAEILEGLPGRGTAILNYDDPELRRIGAAHEGHVVWFGRHRECDVSAEAWRGTIFGMRFQLRLGADSVDIALPLAGVHNVQNFLAAAAAAHNLGVTPTAIAARALDVRAADHRGRVIRLKRGITLLDDSYNSNPVAVTAAVAALNLAPEGRRVAVLGDMRELGPSAPELHERCGAEIASRVDLLVGVGELARGFIEGAQRVGFDSSSAHVFEDSAAAAAGIPNLIRAGDAVLVKGSRGLKTETIVAALIADFGVVEE
jgi:UDP-N-acetylmuramoyl-tripeptide--D-alanyl-D-alanine ligase